MTAKRAAAICLWAFLAANLWISSCAALEIGGIEVSRPGAEGRRTFNFQIEADKFKEDRIVLKNASTRIRKISVYVADGYSSKEGKVVIKGKDAERKGLAKWIAIDAPERIVLKPSQQRYIWFKLSVPPFSEPEEKVAGLVVETVQMVKEQGKAGSGSAPNSKAVFLITQRLPGPSLSEFKIASFTHSWVSGDKVFRTAIKSSGNVQVKPKTRIDIYGVSGEKVVSLKQTGHQTVLPQTTSDALLKWRNPPLVGFFTAKATTINGAGEARSSRLNFLILPWWITLAVGAVLAMVTQLARSRKTKIEATSAEKNEQTILDAIEDELRKTKGAEKSLEPALAVGAAEEPAVAKPRARMERDAGAVAKTGLPPKTAARSRAAGPIAQKPRPKRKKPTSITITSGKKKSAPSSPPTKQAKTGQAKRAAKTTVAGGRGKSGARKRPQAAATKNKGRRRKNADSDN